jgi:16S rRNA A1518/A1519 N6-dimethyltransferase RsmA/KsgA/DIM1 with predicted DNA glycosylase/AP lyase activity
MIYAEILRVVFIFGILVFFLFTFVIIFGAPFLPTLKKQVKPAIDLIDLKPGQTLLELGSGDGRVLIAAAEAGLNAVGYELNPLLVIYSWLRTRKYRRQIKIVWGNYWKKTWPDADGIFVFLLNPYMDKLNTKIIQNYKKPIKLVSHAFKLPNREEDMEKHGLFLYKYNFK